MRRRIIVLLGLALLLAAPLLGVLPTGLRLGLFAFPPLVLEPPVHAPFSWPVWILFAGILAGTSVLMAFPRLFGFKPGESPPRTAARMPAWGYAGIILTILAWVAAWGRFEWLGVLRDYMFSPLWFGYVLTMDGLVFRRTGTSLIARSTGRFLLLFPTSAISWWYFEYLNRFVQNWWYEGITDFTSAHYIVHASLCFSTVLPGIFETSEWLLSFDHFASAFQKGMKWRALSKPAIGAVMAVGVISLLLMGRFTDPLFFLTWVEPLIILERALALAGVQPPFHRLKEGDYTMLISLALAALICGFFWEMWNFHSLPKWNYSVPYVYRYRLFEMPIVGYGGYFPFGPVCWSFWLAWCVLVKGKSEHGRDYRDQHIHSPR